MTDSKFKDIKNGKMIKGKWSLGNIKLGQSMLKRLEKENKYLRDGLRSFRQELEESLGIINYKIDVRVNNHKCGEDESNYLFGKRSSLGRIIYEFDKRFPQVNDEDFKLSLCSGCNCMTKTINNKCGKCNSLKVKKKLVVGVE